MCIHMYVRLIHFAVWWKLTQRCEATPTLCYVPSVMSDSVTPWTVARQAPLSMRFSRQDDGSGVSFPSPGDLPDPGIEPVSH